jgi:hypothetical protein
VNRSKRSGYWPPFIWQLFEQSQLVNSLVFLLLRSYVLSDRIFISTNGGYMITPGPELLARKIASLAKVIASDMNRAFTLNKSNHLRNRVFGWN